MNPRINYHYTVPFKLRFCYDFIRYNNVVSEECYKHRVYPYLQTIVDHLNNNDKSRQEVIVTHKQFENLACLISIQFQIVKKKLIVIANFRSECAINGRPNDSKMLQHIATLVMSMLELERYKIYVNVANYHERTAKNPMGY